MPCGGGGGKLGALIHLFFVALKLNLSDYDVLTYM